MKPVFQVKSGTIFDNFLITDDVKEAEEVGKETWGVTKVCYCSFVHRTDQKQAGQVSCSLFKKTTQIQLISEINLLKKNQSREEKMEQLRKTECKPIIKTHVKVKS